MRKVSLKREVFICCHNSNFTTGGGISGGIISSSFSSIKYFFSRLDHCKNICKLLNLLKQQHIHLCCNKQTNSIDGPLQSFAKHLQQIFQQQKTHFQGESSVWSFFCPLHCCQAFQQKTTLEDACHLELDCRIWLIEITLP